MLKRNFHNEKIRCSGKYQIGRVVKVESINKIGNSMCKSFCNNDVNCQFFSLNDENECRLYSKCDESEKSKSSEYVYEKHNHGKL